MRTAKTGRSQGAPPCETSSIGFVEGPDGTFGWSEPDEEVHRFHN
jgi:hypothetical protein